MIKGGTGGGRGSLREGEEIAGEHYVCFEMESWIWAALSMVTA